MSNYNYSFRRNRLVGPTRQVSSSDIYNPTVGQKHTLGLEFDLNDSTGRMFRYTKAGSTGLVKATMNQAEAVTANWVDEPQTVSGGAVIAAIGDTSITLLVQTAPTVNVWNDGWMLVNNGTGKGELYLIKEHTLTGNPVVQIVDTGGIRTATVDGTDITILKNLHRDVIVVPAGAGTHTPIGVALTTVTADYFFWAQYRGPCPMLVDTNGGGAALVPGNMCGEPTAAQDDGTVGVVEADGTLVIYGTVLWIAEDLQYGLVDLLLP